MKRFFILALCFLLLLTFVGCDSTDLKSGYYFAGDYEEPLTPYVNLNFEDKSLAFRWGARTLFRIRHSRFVDYAVFLYAVFSGGFAILISPMQL